MSASRVLLAAERRQHPGPQDVGELVGQRVHVPVDRLAGLLHRVDRDVEVDQLQRDVEGRQRLVAVPSTRSRDLGQPLDLVVAELAPRPGLELAPGHRLAPAGPPGGEHRPLEREVLDAGVDGHPAEVLLDRGQREPVVLERPDQLEPGAVLAAV